jgi:glycogen operon protein
MTRRDWQGDARTLGVFLNGREISSHTPRGEPIEDDSFLIVMNAHYERVAFALPPRRFGLRWALELSTADPGAEPFELPQRGELQVEQRSLVLLRRAA